MQNNLSLTLQQLDAVGAVMARRIVSFSDTTPTVGEWRAGLLPDTSQTTISLPTTQIRQLFIRNTHASATISITWTPTTGAAVVVIVLGPNDEISFWHQAAGATYGLSSLKLTASVANATYEMFIGG